MKKHRINLALVLPGDAGECEACIQRLLDGLRSQSGVVDAHVDASEAESPTLCLHYDPTAVQMTQVRSVVEEAGARLVTQFAHLAEAVDGLRHERQAKLVEKVLAGEPGLLHVAVAFGTRRLFAEFDPRTTSRSAVVAAAARAGIRIAGGTEVAAAPKHGPDHDHEHAHGGLFGERTELVFSLACGVLTGVGWALDRADVVPPAALICFVGAYILGSWFTVQEVFVALRGRRFEIDFLMLFAAVGAAMLGEWFEGALLLFLFTLGHALEGFAMSRARNAIEALQKLVPQTALRLDEVGGGEQEVPVEHVVLGDRLLIKPNTRIPADGFVVAGTSPVNQAPITGESLPVDKRPVDDVQAAEMNLEVLPPEHRVFAGTVNGGGALTVAVTKLATDSAIARVVRMVQAAETQKSPTQQFTQRFERRFVPVILAVVVLLLFAWVVIDEPFASSFYRSMAVLVAASPCALAIATPSAVLAAVARAARGGVLIKGGADLESLGLVRAIAFDKTGTLTEGRPRLVDIVPSSGTTTDMLLSTAAAVERLSDHPLARAIVESAVAGLSPEAKLPEVANVEAVVGFGVQGTVGELAVRIGKPGMFTREGPLPAEVGRVVEKLESDGRTVMVVKSGDEFLGALGVMDTPRSSARKVIQDLHRLGIERTVMLTGDNQRVADAVADYVGIREARGNLLPEAKVAAIAELARSSTRVAMVGDGVNDAPAMAKATVGIAMGAAGSDVALETAGVALMADDLHALPFAVGLSRAARRIIQQNLWASLGMVAFLVPATIFGLAGIGAAVALHEGSTLVVVANALRLLAYRDRRRKTADDDRQEGATPASGTARKA